MAGECPDSGDGDRWREWLTAKLVGVEGDYEALNTTAFAAQHLGPTWAEE
jgi:hypothetical protein